MDGMGKRGLERGGGTAILLQSIVIETGGVCHLTARAICDAIRANHSQLKPLFL